MQDDDRALRLVDGLRGDSEALTLLAEEDGDGAEAQRHRVGAALALAAGRAGVEAPAAWRRQLLASTAQHMALEADLVATAKELSAAGVGWIPLKGVDLANRVYEKREQRQTADLDLLVAAADLERGRDALRAAGWRDLDAGTRVERYLLEEGYAWQTRSPAGTLVEVHYRLWGSVAAGFEEELMARAEIDPELPSGGRRLSLAHAFVVAAVHAWHAPAPRGVGLWRDLERIASSRGEDGDGELADDVVDIAGRWDLQLPVSLAAGEAARLWNEPTCGEIAERLAGELRPVERLVARRREGRTAALSLAAVTAARLVSGRRSRHRARVLWRRLWAHPGTVEQATSEDWSWPKRRLWYQLAASGLGRPARWLAGTPRRGR